MRDSELAQWRTDWAALMDELGLAPDTRPEDVSDWLQTVAEILNTVEETRVLHARILGIDTDAQRLKDLVDGLLARLAPDLKERPIEESVPALARRLAGQRDARTRRDELLTQARRTERELKESHAALENARESLAELCRLADREDPEQLSAAEDRSRARRRLEEELRLVETE